MKRSIVVLFAVALALSAAGCGVTGIGIASETETQVGMQEETSRNNEKASVQINSVKFLEAFGIGHPPAADDRTDVFVLNSEKEEAGLLKGFDSVSDAISADYENETVILITFTACSITYEDEYSIKAIELTEGVGGAIEIYYTSTSDRGYDDAECPYYAIIVVPKISIPAEGIGIRIDNLNLSE